MYNHVCIYVYNIYPARIATHYLPSHQSQHNQSVLHSRNNFIPQQPPNLLRNLHDSLLRQSSPNNLHGNWCSMICFRIIYSHISKFINTPFGYHPIKKKIKLTLRLHHPIHLIQPLIPLFPPIHPLISK